VTAEDHGFFETLIVEQIRLQGMEAEMDRLASVYPDEGALFDLTRCLKQQRRYVSGLWDEVTSGGGVRSQPPLARRTIAKEG
jgi:hypothetical protein